MHDVVHVNLLKPHRRSRVFQQRPMPAMNYVAVQPEDERWYVVEKLVSELKASGSHSEPRYRVRWAGYPPSEDTLEKRSHLRRDLGRDVLNNLVKQMRAAAAQQSNQRR